MKFSLRAGIGVLLQQPRRLVLVGPAQARHVRHSPATLLSVPIGFVNEQSYHAHAASYIDQCNLVESENNSEGVDLVLYSDICDGTVYATATLSNNLGGSVPDTIHLRDDTVGVQVDSKSGDLKNGVTIQRVVQRMAHLADQVGLA